jgi:DNA-binding LacI/PurR family transcriptional regulator
VPIVFADRYIEGIPAPYVGSNNEQGAFEATQHLLSLGHTRIGFISPQPTITTISERRQGYFRAFAMTENKVHPSEMMHDILSDMPGMDNSLNFREDIERMKRYLSEQRDVTALLCTDYSVMKICETAARELGISIPGELSMVCFDVPHDRFSRESYTHVAQQEATLGRTAVELLCDVLEGRAAPQKILLDTELRIASSTARREAPRHSARRNP